ncbi:MAG: hypothetical protein E7316_02415 [Clostridiales bacterium]|nr:hypothetical protein [Clostridiales bacterium]
MSDKQLARYRALSECLVMQEALQRMFSRSESLLEPKDGYERPWAEARERCMVIREMLKEVRYADEGDAVATAGDDPPKGSDRRAGAEGQRSEPNDL